MAASVRRPLREVFKILKNAWDKEPIVVISCVYGSAAASMMFLSPTTYKQEEEMKNWPSVYNFYDLSKNVDRIYEHTDDPAQPVWRTDYQD